MASLADKSSTLELVNLQPTLDALKNLEPSLARHLDFVIRAAAGGVAVAASGRVDSRTGEAAGGFGVRRYAGRYAVFNNDVGAHILENAGRVNPGGLSPQGESLIQTIESRYGSPGRLLWAGWMDRREATEEQIEDAVEQTVAELEAKVGELD